MSSCSVWVFLLLTAGVWCSQVIECPQNDELCEKDKMGFEAIMQLHVQVDDDANGNLDRSESDEFIRDELKYEDGFDRHSNFHGTDDLISVADLWKLWVQSEVYNWTVDETLEWLVNHVELPQYSESFNVNAVDGKTLPRIAANSQYVPSILGIKNPLHKQMLSLKATDLVLFGAPKKDHNYVKDLLLVVSLVIAVGGCWLAYVQNKYSQSHLKKVMKDLETLQTAEDSLTQLQQKWEVAQKEQKIIAEEKQSLEHKMKGEMEVAKVEANRLRCARETTEEEISRLRLAEEELVQVRMALKQSEKELDDRHIAPLVELQPWVQFTYEIENLHYKAKHEAAEMQLMVAKEMCEKIRKKRNAFLGSFRIAHTTSIDDTDHKIMSARSALEEVKRDLQERSYRWHQMERICGFNIILNPGLVYLETILRSSGGMTSTLTRQLSGSILAPVNLDDADEDMPPGYMTSSGRTEPRVWPNLMRAGMQLTMFGLGLTNPNQRAAHSLGMAPGDMKDKRLANVTSAFGGSSSSLSSQGSSLGNCGAHNNTSSLLRPSPLTKIPSGDQDSEDDQRLSDQEDSSISFDESTVHESTVPKFDLGDTTHYREFVADLNSQQQKSNTYHKSTSVDAATVRPMPRTKTLPTSLSDSAIMSGSGQMPRSRTMGNDSRRLVGTPPRASTLEEHSSPESTDSANHESLEAKEKKKKKKKHLFGKLLSTKKESSKSKTS